MDIEMSHWLKHQANSLLLDVRTPGEFTQGHIPGAVNLPLFSDEERAIIGTLYVQQGRQQAVDEGIRILGPRLWNYISEARSISSGNPVSVYCWRGGMRSGFAAWLLDMGGMKVNRLKGGYKAFRRYGEALISETSWSFIVLGGATGSGKTPILHELKLLGEQVLDLEALAHHKGSVFGAIGQPSQPTTEQFINSLYYELTMLDPRKRIWLESESKLIGRVFIPDGLWEVICHAPIVHLDIPLEVRAEHIVAEYGRAPIPELMAPFERIAKRLGREQKQRAQAALLSGDVKTAAIIALGYYDKAYNRSLAKDWGTPMLTLSVCEDCPLQTARLLLSELEKYQNQQSV
ncbi:MAG: tRNA 2-selenouridine(34) synthase MnmH [Porphyromonadaceae bacterium]|nr:tRNA 2-selenouridine(34) synthase MnmH [Porphyromonadaceae bacterium]